MSSMVPNSAADDGPSLPLPFVPSAIPEAPVVDADATRADADRFRDECGLF